MVGFAFISDTCNCILQRYCTVILPEDKRISRNSRVYYPWKAGLHYSVAVWLDYLGARTQSLL